MANDSQLRALTTDRLIVLLKFCGFVALAVLLGGGGVTAAFLNLAVQLAAIALIASEPSRTVAFFSAAPRGLVVLMALTIALPLSQSIPLPPALWQHLPGRDMAVQSLDLVGHANAWFPLSLDSARTLVAAISLIPAIAVIIFALTQSTQLREWPVALIVALGAINMLMGLMQLASGNTTGNFYPGGEAGTLYGTFANRNTTALFLDIAIIAAMALRWPHDGRKLFLISPGIAAAFAVGVVLTHSRSGIALLAVVAIGQGIISWPDLKRRRLLTRKGLLAVAIVLVLGAMGGALALRSSRVAYSLSRFGNDGNNRSLIWNDATITAKRYIPVGAGIGTFDEVFQIDESLEAIDSTRAGRAHSDWLETVIETGFAGVAIAVMWIIYLAVAVWRSRASVDYAQRASCALALLLIALQSIVDYPLRNEALLCIAALLISLLCRPQLVRRLRVQQSSSRVSKRATSRNKRAK